jgi:hypothetical protein
MTDSPGANPEGAPPSGSSHPTRRIYQRGGEKRGESTGAVCVSEGALAFATAVRWPLWIGLLFRGTIFHSKSIPGGLHQGIYLCLGLSKCPCGRSCAHAGVASFPRARSFDHKGTYFTRDKDMQ